ncbi:MAG TPA: hypothetical protein VHE10_02045 [Candidatus Paceibacterota bacterium]|nr:hypothetical protein [Candidatus Paceibacterota bacterium]
MNPLDHPVIAGFAVIVATGLWLVLLKARQAPKGIEDEQGFHYAEK